MHHQNFQDRGQDCSVRTPFIISGSTRIPWISDQVRDDNRSSLRIYVPPLACNTIIFGNPTKTKKNRLGAAITLGEIVQDMVFSGLADARKHALLKLHGYQINVSGE